MTEQEALLSRLVGMLVQLPHDPAHHFAVPVVQCSPRRVMDVMDRPGGPSSDFDGAIA